jgi:hypothetical protein
MMNSYDDLIEALDREDKLSTTSDAQRESNAHRRNLYQHLKSKRSNGDTPTYDNSTLAMDIMLKRLNDPTYRFSIRSLFSE